MDPDASRYPMPLTATKKYDVEAPVEVLAAGEPGGQPTSHDFRVEITILLRWGRISLDHPQHVGVRSRCLAPMGHNGFKAKLAARCGTSAGCQVLEDGNSNNGYGRTIYVMPGI